MEHSREYTVGGCSGVAARGSALGVLWKCKELHESATDSTPGCRWPWDEFQYWLSELVLQVGRRTTGRGRPTSSVPVGPSPGTSCNSWRALASWRRTHEGEAALGAASWALAPPAVPGRLCLASSARILGAALTRGSERARQPLVWRSVWFSGGLWPTVVSRRWAFWGFL